MTDTTKHTGPEWRKLYNTEGEWIGVETEEIMPRKEMERRWPMTKGTQRERERVIDRLAKEIFTNGKIGEVFTRDAALELAYNAWDAAIDAAAHELKRHLRQHAYSLSISEGLSAVVLALKGGG